MCNNITAFPVISAAKVNFAFLYHVPLTTTSKAHIAVLLTNLFFGINFSLVKLISPNLVGPYALNILRVTGSLILMWSAWFWGRHLSKEKTVAAGIEKKDIGRFAICGLTGVAINQTFFIKGLTITSTIHASLLMLCTPLMITLLAFWILKERITTAKAIGIALGIGGASLLIISKDKGAGTSSWEGDLLIITNAISYTFYFILVKPLMSRYPPQHVIRWVFTFGLLMILPVGAQQFTEIRWEAFQFTHIAALTFIVICGTYLAYSFTIYGIQHLGAGVTGSYIYTQPVFASMVAILFLHEVMTGQKVIAAALIFTGVYLVSLHKRVTYAR